MVGIIFNVLKLIVACYIIYILLEIVISKKVLYNLKDKLYSLNIKIKKDKDNNLKDDKLCKNIFFKYFIYKPKNNIDKIKQIYNIKFDIPLLFFYIISLILGITGMYFSYKVINIFVCSIVVFVMCFFSLNFLLELLIMFHKNKIFKYFPIFLLELKNYINISNDIIQAFMSCSKNSVLSTYLDDFSVYIKAGVKLNQALENLKQDIDIKLIGVFLDMCNSCYTSGGSFKELIERFYDYYTRNNKMYQKEMQKRVSIIAILMISVVINMYFVLGFVFQNSVYKDIIVNTFAGKLLMTFNIIIYLVMFIVVKKSNKMEE